MKLQSLLRDLIKYHVDLAVGCSMRMASETGMEMEQVESGGYCLLDLEMASERYYYLCKGYLHFAWSLVAGSSLNFDVADQQLC